MVAGHYSHHFSVLQSSITTLFDFIWLFCPQTLTPHMQCARGKATSRVTSSSSTNCSKATHMDDQDEGNISMDLWKKAFEDAFERLCPVRAAGHECGCLPVLPKLVSIKIQYVGFSCEPRISLWWLKVVL